VVAAGDSGAAGCDDPHTETAATHASSVSVLAATPYTVAVGGTEFNENGNNSTYWKTTNAQATLESAISYIPEDVWNQSCTLAQSGCTKAYLWQVTFEYRLTSNIQLSTNYTGRLEGAGDPVHQLHMEARAFF
jgi:subtilase family serine protease